MKTVFLGGTCNGSKWRNLLIPLLKINYFDPVVPNWTSECQEREIKAREDSDYVLYIITPKMTGVYSIAEVVDDSNKRPNKTVFCFLDSDLDENGTNVFFSAHQLKSLLQVEKMVSKNGARVFDTLEEVAEYLNG